MIASKWFPLAIRHGANEVTFAKNRSVIFVIVFPLSSIHVHRRRKNGEGVYCMHESLLVHKCTLLVDNVIFLCACTCTLCMSVCMNVCLVVIVCIDMCEDMNMPTFTWHVMLNLCEHVRHSSAALNCKL